jgi:hypothetical protein
LSDDTQDDAATSIAQKNPAAHLAQYKWQPGQRPEGAGRPKGSRNKLGEDFVRAMQEDFQEYGAAAIVRVREEKPDAYLKVIASILPKELNVNTNAVGELTDDELAALSALVDLARAQLLGQTGSADSTREGQTARH